MSSRLKPHVFTRRAEGLPSIDRDEKDAIRTAFFNLTSLMSEIDPNKNAERTWKIDGLGEVVSYTRRTGHDYGAYRKWSCTRLFDPAQAKALGKLYAAIQDGMERVYLEGKADGAHLLSRLAKGEITTAEFEDERKSR